jgi:ABC-2 type transport system ATP-binding protein
VTSVQRQNGRAVLQLKEGASPQQILRTLSRNDHFTVERFEVALPSLDDIFVQVAQEEDV